MVSFSCSLFIWFWYFVRLASSDDLKSVSPPLLSERICMGLVIFLLYVFHSIH